MNTTIYLIVLVVGLGLFMIPHCLGKKKFDFIPRIEKVEDIQKLFPTSASEINQLVDNTINEAKKQIKALIALPENERSFETVARALDTISSGISITGAALCNLSFVSPDEAVRNAANAGSLKLSEFAVDWLGQNLELYKVFKALQKTRLLASS